MENIWCQYLDQLKELVGSTTDSDALVICHHESLPLHPKRYCRHVRVCQKRVQERIRTFIKRAGEKADRAGIVLPPHVLEGARQELKMEVRRYYDRLATHLRAQGLDPTVVIPYAIFSLPDVARYYLNLLLLNIFLSLPKCTPYYLYAYFTYSGSIVPIREILFQVSPR